MWQKGQSGNPGGPLGPSKPFLDALKRAITQEDGKRVRQAAEKLLTLAAAGEQWAMQMLADRVDGKAAQQLIIDATIARRRAADLSDDELASVVADQAKDDA
jgi:hypothetical protein